MSRPVPLPQALRPLHEVGKVEVRRESADPRGQRGRILLAATRLFGERGYRRVTTDDLAAASNLSLGIVYAFFDDKRDCLLAAYDLIVEEARERIAGRIPAGWPPRRQIDAAIVALLESIAADPLAARLVFVVAPTAGAEGAARHRHTLAAAADALRGTCESGGSDEEPEGLADTVVAAAASLLAASLLDGPPAPSSVHGELRALLLPSAARGEEASTPALGGAGDHLR
jgi:AcrR family transcriptional regulator